MTGVLGLNDFFNLYREDQTETKEADSDNKQKIYYFAIGSAALLEEKRIERIDENNMQQYPSFLRNIRKKYPDIKINIVLIDPHLTSPPYSVKINKNFSQIEPFSNIYIDFDSKTQVFSFNESVEYMTEPRCTCCTLNNIRDNLIMFQNYCIKNNHLMFFHDFSGYPIHFLAHSLDSMLSSSKNNIMYDINLRCFGGCFIDLSNSQNYPILEKKSAELKIFNPYVIEHKGLVEYYDKIKLSTDEDNIYKRNQILIYLYRLPIMLKTIFSLYRRFIATSKSSDKCNIRSDEFNFANVRYGTELYDIFKKYTISNELEELNILTGMAYNYVRSELLCMFDFFLEPNKSAILTDKYMNKLITDKTLYNWHKEVLVEYKILFVEKLGIEYGEDIMKNINVSI